MEISGVTPLADLTPAKNTYEMKVEFAFDESAESFGLELCAGSSQKVRLGFDPRTSQIFLDRRESGEVGFSPKFPVIHTAPFRGAEGKIRMHLFVDQSSIEVFVNDGEVVMTSLIFPDPEAREIRVFAETGGSRLTRLRMWPLKSIWDGGLMEVNQ